MSTNGNSLPTGIAKDEKNMSIGKYYINVFVKGVKKFTSTLCMTSIINGFISVMPVIIVASIVTLIVALPQMVMSVVYGSAGIPDYIANNTAYTGFQDWGGIITNWSMGILGIFVTASISKNMISTLNGRLSFDRKVNETMVFFAAISCYLMLSVIIFSTSNWADPGSKSNAIYTDQLGAQGILPGVLVALTMPWFFYWSYKYDITIRLPKQVPQAISQAFLSIIPLLFVLFIYGTLSYVVNTTLNLPLLPYIFQEIQKGLTGNAQLNNSYALIVLYNFLEAGFWFIGVHPEPVHALMRGTFWIDNLTSNANGGNNLFIEPLMYGFGAMGGSGSTLMVPFICLLLGRSNQLKITGKTAALPIIFQVNEPTLFGVPCVLNPLMLVPMLFTGMINDCLFKLLADSTNFQAGSLWLPWSTPFFLQTSLATPMEYQPWLYSVIAIVVSTLMYLPWVIAQDRMLVQDDRNKLGLNGINYKPNNGLDNIKLNLFKYDQESSYSHKAWIKDQLSQSKLIKKNFELSEAQKEEQLGAWKVQYQSLISGKKIETNDMKMKNLRKFYVEREETRIAKYLQHQKFAEEKLSSVLEAKQKRLTKYQTKHDDKIVSLKEILNSFKLYRDQLNRKIEAGKMKKDNLFYMFIEFKVNRLDKKLLKTTEKEMWYKPKIRVRKEPASRTIIEISEEKGKTKISLAKVELQDRAKILTYDSALNGEKNEYARKCKAEAKATFEAAKTEIEASNLKTVQTSKEEAKIVHDKIEAQFLKGIDAYRKQPKVDNVKINTSTSSDSTDVKKLDKDEYKVLVLCIGAGSSAVFANSIKEGLHEQGIYNIKTTALAWGQHEAALKDIDLLIMSPQLGSYINDVKGYAEQYGFKLITTKARQYIDLSRNSDKAADLVLEQLKK